VSEHMRELGDGWQGRGTSQTRVAFHEDGSTIVWQGGTLIAQASGVTSAVLEFLFGELTKPQPGQESGQGEEGDASTASKHRG
jgi:hypothetical protein